MMRSEDAGDKEGYSEEDEQNENPRKFEMSAEEEKSSRGESDGREWEVVEVDAAGEITTEKIFEDDEGKTKSWLKGLLEKRSDKKESGKEERIKTGCEEFDLEEINSGPKSSKEKEDDELVVFDKYKETALYVNKLNTHLEKEQGTIRKKLKPRQRVYSAENEDVKRIKSEEATEDEDGWDWREVGEDMKEVGSSTTKKKKTRIGGRKKLCRKGFHVTGCNCKPLALIADTST